MKRVSKIIFSLLMLCLSFKSEAAPAIGDHSEILLMTIDPGQEELYSAFGHSALVVRDSVLGINEVYNYGIFDFNQSNFYLNFLIGKLLYKLGTGDYANYYHYYAAINRTWREQTLNLTLAEKQRLFDYLDTNSLPENADYYYDYCFNNCSTKIRDVLDEVLEGKIQYNFDYAQDSMTYRDLMDIYLDEQPWGDLGIDLVLGSQIDQVADGRSYMYMPRYLELALDGAVIKDEFAERDMVVSKKTAHVASAQPNLASTITPLYAFIIIFFIVGISIHRCIKFNVRHRIMDFLLFGSTGLFGCFLTFLWFGTSHLSAYNYNIIWANPLNLIALVVLYSNKKYAIKSYFMLYGVVMLLLVIFGETPTQQLHFSLVPLMMALAMRSFYLFSFLKLKK